MSIPDGAHLLVIPANESAKLEQLAPGRIYEPLFLYESQGWKCTKSMQSARPGEIPLRGRYKIRLDAEYLRQVFWFEQ